MTALMQSQDFCGNRLLAVLPPEEYARLLPNLEPVSFNLGEVIYQSGGRIDYIYFLTDCIVSLLYTMMRISS